MTAAQNRYVGACLFYHSNTKYHLTELIPMVWDSEEIMVQELCSECSDNGLRSLTDLMDYLPDPYQAKLIMWVINDNFKP